MAETTSAPLWLPAPCGSATTPACHAPVPLERTANAHAAAEGGGVGKILMDLV